MYNHLEENYSKVHAFHPEFFIGHLFKLNKVGLYSWIIAGLHYHTIIAVYAQRPSFHATIFFTFQVQSPFKQAAIGLAFLPWNESLSKQAAIKSFLVLFYSVSSWPSSQRSAISWSDPIPHYFLYIKPPFPINKQFSIASFLDWEGLHWDFCSPPSFRQCSQFLPQVQLIPIHLTRYYLWLK